MTDKQIKNFWKKVEKKDDDRSCWLWTASKRNTGYGAFVWVNAAGDIVQGRAHRFSWELHHGSIPEGLCVLHQCDTPGCVRPDHLWIGTDAENARDREAKGRRVAPQGEQHCRAKLTEENVREIRALAESGMRQVDVAMRFGVSQHSISEIVLGKTWKHVEREQGKQE